MPNLRWQSGPSIYAMRRCAQASESDSAFCSQASAPGFVGRAATADRGSASGIYLACYFFGGLVGSAVLGQLFDHFGWSACVAGIAVALAVAALLTVRLKMPAAQPAMAAVA